MHTPKELQTPSLIHPRSLKLLDTPKEVENLLDTPNRFKRGGGERGYYQHLNVFKRIAKYRLLYSGRAALFPVKMLGLKTKQKFLGKRGGGLDISFLDTGPCGVN